MYGGRWSDYNIGHLLCFLHNLNAQIILECCCTVQEKLQSANDQSLDYYVVE